MTRPKLNSSKAKKLSTPAYISPARASWASQEDISDDELAQDRPPPSPMAKRKSAAAAKGAAEPTPKTQPPGKIVKRKSVPRTKPPAKSRTSKRTPAPGAEVSSSPRAQSATPDAPENEDQQGSPASKTRTSTTPDHSRDDTPPAAPSPPKATDEESMTRARPKGSHEPTARAPFSKPNRENSRWFREREDGLRVPYFPSVARAHRLRSAPAYCPCPRLHNADKLLKLLKVYPGVVHGEAVSLERVAYVHCMAVGEVEGVRDECLDALWGAGCALLWRRLCVALEGVREVQFCVVVAAAKIAAESGGKRVGEVFAEDVLLRVAERNGLEGIGEAEVAKALEKLDGHD